MTEYACGDIVICNDLTDKDVTGYGVVVTGNKSFGSLMVYQFITINDHSHAHVSHNVGAFIHMLQLIRDNKNFNIFECPDKTIFIDVEMFFEIDNIELKSHAIEPDSGRIVKLSNITRNNILIPNGFTIIHNDGARHEIVKCKDGDTITMSNDIVYEYSTKTIFNEFSDDIIINLISKLWPLVAGDKKRTVISQIALRNSLKMRDKERE